jgi:hypothetical protein
MPLMLTNYEHKCINMFVPKLYFVQIHKIGVQDLKAMGYAGGIGCSQICCLSKYHKKTTMRFLLIGWGTMSHMFVSIIHLIIGVYSISQTQIGVSLPK